MRTSLRILRSSGNGELLVRLATSGSATPNRDYVLSGIEGDEATILLPEGRTEAEIELAIVDDVAAEPTESLLVQVTPGSGYVVDPERGQARLTIPQNDFVVTTTADSGEGSLRQALLNANSDAREEVEAPIITFDPQDGPFANPQTILLASPLPEIVRPVVIDGYIPNRIWSATGVTISGSGMHRVLRVPKGPDAELTLRHISVAHGSATQGAGILNEGRLVVESVTFVNNEATEQGGAIANDGGTVTVINSTFTGNRADAGGGMANVSGSATVTNCTFSENTARTGGGLFNAATLLLRNTILANSGEGDDCASVGPVDPESTANLIEANHECGTPTVTEDPRLGELGYYNGPTPTIPLGGGSPAINLGDNDAARDANGEPLVWDQRGNGDPRFVAGFTDIGAFEQQKFPDFTVDTTEDSGLRACTAVRLGDCPLRAALELANATPEPDVIRFDPEVFHEPKTLRFQGPLPEVVAPVSLDATGTGGITLRADGDATVLNAAPGVDLVLIDVTLFGVEENMVR